MKKIIFHSHHAIYIKIIVSAINFFQQLLLSFHFLSFPSLWLHTTPSSINTQNNDFVKKSSLPGKISHATFDSRLILSFTLHFHTLLHDVPCFTQWYIFTCTECHQKLGTFQTSIYSITQRYLKSICSKFHVVSPHISFVIISNMMKMSLFLVCSTYRYHNTKFWGI